MLDLHPLRRFIRRLVQQSTERRENDFVVQIRQQALRFRGAQSKQFGTARCRAIVLLEKSYVQRAEREGALEFRSTQMRER